MNSPIEGRLSSLRARMKEKDLNAFIVYATDKYLNEYIPQDENMRVYLSGFTGSTGDMLVTEWEAYLFVDGRYYTQADLEVSPSLIHVVKMPYGTSGIQALRDQIKGLVESSDTGFTIGFNGRKVSYHDISLLIQDSLDLGFQLIDTGDDLIGYPVAPLKEGTHDSLMTIPLSITGKSSLEKVEAIREWLMDHQCDFVLISQLDDLAYLCNMRSYEIPYNSTFKGLAFLSRAEGHIFLDMNPIPQWIKEHFHGVLQVHPEEDFTERIPEIIAYKADPPINIGFDKDRTSYYTVNQLNSWLGEQSELIQIESPLSKMKRIKTPEELKYMAYSFHQADKVIKKSIDWLNNELNSGKTLSERDFSEKVKATFFAHNAKALSFEVITASGENGAIVHYTKADPDKILTAGDLMLLDTGAYFEGGYATDLTRTFLMGGKQAKATSKQKEVYTLVLKSAIRVLKARFPMGTKGVHLDTLARSPLWDYGYIYNHGTGHGVGICVHEVPPRVSSTSDDVLEENMVFSVEPGVYIEGYGGVRIENLVTLVRDPLYDGWLKVQPLTFAPLDHNLIDDSYLDHWERQWLKEYSKKSDSLES